MKYLAVIILILVAYMMIVSIMHPERQHFKTAKELVSGLVKP